MKIEEFLEHTNKLEKFFNKELEQFEKDIWFQELKPLTAKRYLQIIKKLYTQNKFMPKLADIVELNRILPFDNNQQQTKKENCKRCGNKGFIIYQTVYNGNTYDTFAKCTCKNAEPYKAWPSIEQVGL